MARVLAILLLAFTVLPVHAAEPLKDPAVYCLIHPKCCLDKAEAEQSLTKNPLDSAAKVVYSLGFVTPKVVVGLGVKDVPPTGDCFILELPETKVSGHASFLLGTPPGERTARKIPITMAKIEQHYKLWFRKDGGEPELLGQGTVFGMENPRRDAANGFTILKLSLPELAKLRMGVMHESIAKNLSNSYCDKIFVMKPAPGTAQLAKQVNGRDTLPWPEFKPSRVSEDKDGNWVIEVDLHSRLPVFAACTLYRTSTEAE
jgi:hypothetical protein